MFRQNFLSALRAVDAIFMQTLGAIYLVGIYCLNWMKSPKDIDTNTNDVIIFFCLLEVLVCFCYFDTLTMLKVIYNNYAINRCTYLSITLKAFIS